MQAWLASAGLEKAPLRYLPGLLVRHALLPCLPAHCQHALVLRIALLTSAWPVTQRPGPSLCVTCLPGHSNAGVLAALSLTGAALFWPSLMALPYEVLVLYHILLWAQHKRPGQIAPARALQAYTGKAEVAFKYVHKSVRHCRGPVHISGLPLMDLKMLGWWELCGFSWVLLSPPPQQLAMLGGTFKSSSRLSNLECRTLP